ncbi:SUMF1/EgtB/PvdO family nonheme iron enzyme [Flavobacterium yafengii]|uniref:SUMF1/EgtB/PvdO family nonheme iron enzyme n=1 Tax=Flavobacterium yafengii TaxID=3041253 RepID=UPI003D159674
MKRHVLYAKPRFQTYGPANGNQYVVRGGSWHETATSWRSSFRKAYKADYRGISIGFRLVKTAD